MKLICPNCLKSSEIESVQENGVALCPVCGNSFHPGKELPLPDKNAPKEPVPAAIGRFSIKRLIGRGGMCCVYEGTHPELNIPVALKVPRSEFAEDEEFCARFSKSAKICAKISHPNIVKVYEYGEDSTTKLPYLVMEYIGGGSLGDLLSMHGCLSAMETVRIAHSVCQGLLIAEKKGIVHRDIKPDNIMISNDGQYKLADLGLAKQDIVREDRSTAQMSGDGIQYRTNSMYSLGTLEFMPPEQLINASACDSRADIYSLGVTMYQLATGHLPLECGENDDYRQILLTRDPFVPSKYEERLPLLFDYIVMNCIQKTRIYRYQSFRELNTDLEAYLDGQSELPSMHVDPPVLTSRPSSVRNISPDSKKLILAATVLLLAILILAMFLAIKLFGNAAPKQVSGIVTAPVQHIEETDIPEENPQEKQDTVTPSRSAEEAKVTVTTLEESHISQKTHALFQDCKTRAEQAMRQKDDYAKIIKELQGFTDPDLEPEAKALIHALEVSRNQALLALMRELDARAMPLLKDGKWDQAIKVYHSNIMTLKEESQELRDAKIRDIDQQRKQSFQDSIIPMQTQPI